MTSALSWEDNDGSKNAWVKDIHEAKREVVEVRQEIPPDYIHTPPFDVPEIVDYYNRVLHKYAAQIRPKRHDVGPIWDEELETVEIPPSGDVDLGLADVYGNIDTSSAIQKLDWETKPVRLDNLNEWSTGYFQVTFNYLSPGQGKQSMTERRNLALPVYAGEAVFEALNECLNELGWLPEATARPYESKPLAPGGPNNE